MPNPPASDLPPNARYAFSFAESETIEADVITAGMQATVVPVLFRRGDVTIAKGTAFCVSHVSSGDAVFVTANHVIDELVEAEDIEVFILLPRDVDSEEGRRELRGVRVHLITHTPDFGDVAFMVANLKDSELPTTDRLRGLPLTLSRPEVGEPCMALGFPQRSGDFSYTLVASRGFIEEVYPARRDTVLGSFPGFTTTGRYRSGMSGGPIIDTRGRVVGIISLGTDAEEAAFVQGYAASAAALVELKIDLRGDDGVAREFSFGELYRAGLLDVDGAVTLNRTEHGVTLDWNVEQT